MRYFEELKRSMNYLSKNEKTIFIGQAVEVPGTAMSNTLKDIPSSKLLELPVAEEMQMGITTGLALDSNIPISIFPRWNFLLLAMIVGAGGIALGIFTMFSSINDMLHP